MTREHLEEVARAVHPEWPESEIQRLVNDIVARHHLKLDETDAPQKREE